MRFDLYRRLRCVATTVVIATGITSILVSCNESVENLLKEEYPSPTIPQESKNKVLWIVLDGANGEAVRQAYIQRKADNIRGMLDKAYYSFDGLADIGERMVNDSIAWQNLLVASNDKATVEGGQSIFSLMKDQGMSTALITADQYLNDHYGRQADNTFCGNDNDVEKKAIQAIAGDETSDLTVVEFGGVRVAGDKNGYFDESLNTATPAIISAIHEADMRIGRIMATLKARKNYTSENWLVMVTSNRGGTTDWDEESMFDRMDRKTFTVMYNENIDSKMLQRPSANDVVQYEYYTLRYNGSGDTECAMVNDPALFDFAYDTEEEDTNKVTNYTVQFMYCHVGKKENRSEMMVSKAIRNDPASGEGWTIRRRYGTFYSQYNGVKIYSAEQSTSNINDAIWHVMTMVFDYRKNQLLIYRDGELDMHKNNYPGKLQKSVGIADKAPLTIGKIYSASAKANTPFYVSNLQVYDVALPADWIAKNYKLTNLEKKADTFKYWNNLIGYWPADREEEYMGSVLHDYSKYGSILGGKNAGRSDMTVTNPTWTSGASAEVNVSPLISDSYYQKVINTRDIAYQTLQWMGVSIDSRWNLSGIGRAFKYIK